jgi:hypothetical protein
LEVGFMGMAGGADGGTAPGLAGTALELGEGTVAGSRLAVSGGDVVSAERTMGLDPWFADAGAADTALVAPADSRPIWPDVVVPRHTSVATPAPNVADANNNTTFVLDRHPFTRPAALRPGDSTDKLEA